MAKEAENKTGVCQGCQESLDTGLDTTQKEIVTYYSHYLNFQVRVRRRLEKIRKLVHRLKNGTEAEELLRKSSKFLLYAICKDITISY